MTEPFWFPIYEKRTSSAIKSQLRIGTILRFPHILDDPLAQVQQHSDIKLPSTVTRTEPEYVYPRDSTRWNFRMHVTKHNVRSLSDAISPKTLVALINIPKVLEFTRNKVQGMEPVYIITGLRETVRMSFVQEAPLVKTPLEPLDSALGKVRQRTGVRIPHVYREAKRDVKEYFATENPVVFAYQMHVLWPMPDGSVKMHVYSGHSPAPLNKRAIIEAA